ARLDAVPTPVLASAVVVNGVAEEVLQRAVAFPLLAGLTGSAGAGAALTVLGAAAAHGPGWGAGPAVALVLSGAVMMSAYLASGDLWALVLAHVLIDTAGLLLPRLRRRA
ncbi:MAG: CPBP family intramembrane metalloprotease, partial [Rhodobacteraceae bacterium]|nr:CPBP family intramembrane metalloprotease [Paracoccaceae bacterium]